MRIIHLNNLWTVIIDCIAWFILHMSIAYGATLLPVKLFNEQMWLYRIRKWEKAGKLYNALFGIESWKDKLPDGASWFSQGFAKKGLAQNNDLYLDRFVKETCRGEFAHWMVILVSPLFFLFNPWYAGVIMIIYALLANMPCIIVQRYNRPRLIRIRDRKLKRRKASGVLHEA